MLYDQWQSVVRERSRQLALVNSVGGERWTFAELDEAARHWAPSAPGIVTPSGNGPEFILSVIAAWKQALPVLPVEGTVLERPAIVPPGIAHLKTTSGTTGERQVIAFTAKQLASDAANIVATMRLRPDQPNLGVISLAHSYGFSNLVTPLLLHGIPLILCPSPMPEVVRIAAMGHPRLALPAVPAMWRVWHEAAAIPGNVNLAISAGAPLPLELERAVFQQSGLKIHNFYGSSECGGIAFDRAPEPREDGSMVGEPLAGVALSVADDGCLVVRSGAVGTGYLPTTDGRLGNGVFHTSDLAELRDGRVFLRGRSSDVINVSGRKLSPETVEALIRCQAGVRECVVVGIPARDESRGEEVLAVVSLAPGASLEGVRSAVSGGLVSWQRPRYWWEVPEIESTQRGKISRRQWRDSYLASVGGDRQGR